MCALILGLGAAAPAAADFFNGFETDTSGWLTFTGSGSTNQEADGYVSPVPYASGISSAPDPSDPGLPRHHARLRRGDCVVDGSGGGGPSVECDGPFTRWGGYNTVWLGGYTTQVDVYLDVVYAAANPDSYAGNIVCLTADPSDNTCKGTRFDFSSALQDSGGNFLSDFVYNVGTGDPGQPNPCTSGGFVVAASNNAFRSNAYPQNPGKDPFCVATSGWYTFRHRFTDVAGTLVVVMDLLPQGSNVPLHTWTMTTTFATNTLGCNLYGWFAEQEIQDLAIDNSRMEGCGAPLATTTTTVTTTTTSTTVPTCGNGMVDGGEQCDPALPPSCPGSPGGAFLPCNPDCTCPAFCGNGIVDSGEQCDPAGSACGSPAGAFVCDAQCACVLVPTTTTTQPTVTTSSVTSSTQTSTTSVTTTTATSTTTIPCMPTGSEAGSCIDMIDNDCDGLIDCADPDCLPTRCVGGTQDGQDCSTNAGIEACTLGGGVCQCPRIQKDPTTITFRKPGATLDRLRSHGRVTILGPVDIMGAEVGWLLSNNRGRIFGVVLPAGTLTATANRTLFKYKNVGAKSRGGVYRALIRVKLGTSYAYTVEAYGDMSAATDANMAIQLYMGHLPTSAIHSEVWTRTKNGWRATGIGG